MFSYQFNELAKTENIKLRTYQGRLTALISYPDKFTILLLNHYGNIKINFVDYRVAGECILFLCPNEVVQVPDYIEIKEISFSKDKNLINAEEFNYAYGSVHKMFKLDKSTYQTVHKLFIEACILHSKMPTGCNENIFKILLEIFRLSFTYIKRPNYPDSLLAYNFISLVHEQYAMHHEMSHYARLLRVSAKRIAEKFKVLGIMPPHSFIKQRIIIEVKRQLICTNKTVKLICFDVGFNDPAYFSRFFKKNTGMNTSEFLVDYHRQFSDRTNNPIEFKK